MFLETARIETILASIFLGPKKYALKSLQVKRKSQPNRIHVFLHAPSNERNFIHAKERNFIHANNPLDNENSSLYFVFLHAPSNDALLHQHRSGFWPVPERSAILVTPIKEHSRV